MAFFDAELNLKTSIRGRFTDVMARLFMDVDRDNMPRVLRGYPEQLKGLIDLVYHGRGQDVPVYHWEPSKEVQRLDEADAGSIVIGFSGGKDSLAAAIHYQNQGLNPVLFHVQGINRAYSSETECALEVAKNAKMEIVLVHTKGQRTNSIYKENPVKDQMILAMMVDWGYDLGLYKHSMGIENTNKLEHSNILYNWSDSVEMFEAGNKWITSEFPDFEWSWCIKNHSQSMRLICDRDFSLLSSTIGCLTPQRFQKMRKELTESKFGITLIKNRCGVCWKCCVEYLNLMSMGLVKVHEEFARKCFNKFKQDLPIAYGGGYLDGASDWKILKTAVDPEFIDPSPIMGVLGVEVS